MYHMFKFNLTYIKLHPTSPTEKHGATIPKGAKRNTEMFHCLIQIIVQSGHLDSYFFTCELTRMTCMSTRNEFFLIQICCIPYVLHAGK